MKNWDFINSNVSHDVYVIRDGDLSIDRELRRLISIKAKLKIVKLTKSGMAYLVDENGKHYSVPPRNVREYAKV